MSSARALSHYMAMAAEATGSPQNGCEFISLQLGEAQVVVEYELDPSLTIIGVLINGAWVDHVTTILPSVIERWEREIVARIAADSAADKDSTNADKLAWLNADREWVKL